MFEEKDPGGVTFGEALRASGYKGDVKNRISEASAYLELHIEQGPIFEKEGLSIGVVECVVGMVCYEITVSGESNHAGTTPMSMRNDALFATSDVISELRSKLQGIGDSELVFTMGRLNVYPNIHTVILNKVVFTVEASHKNENIIHKVESIIQGLNHS